MRSAAAYTNKIRVETSVRNNKVEYPGKVAKNIDVLAPTCAADPNFQVLEYKFKSHKCDSKKTQTVLDCALLQ